MRNNKRGNISIFLSVIITTIFSIVLTLCYAAHEKNLESCADGIFRLAGYSLLSEYNYYVQKEYDVFLLSGTDGQLSKKFYNYTTFTTSTLKGAHLSEASASGNRFSICDPSQIYEQILKSMKSPVRSASSIKKVQEIPTDENPMERRTLRHGPTIDSLPSSRIPDTDIVSSIEALSGKITNPSVLFNSSSSAFAIDRYILSHFNSATSPEHADHFFRSEAEYIIAGKRSDESNEKRVDIALEAARVPLNLTHIYSDKSKLAAVTAASEVITPGILGTVTQIGIATAWAAAEAVNDVRLLHAGYKVPIVKDSSSWATDLDGIIEQGGSIENVILPEVNKGQTYNDYLRLLLFAKDRNIKTARIMDLIQINMRNTYDSDFTINTCFSGIEYRAVLNDHEYVYDTMY